jgi:hypothetical protein
MSNPDYLPKNDRKFLQWVINFLSMLFPSLARFGVPEATYQDLAKKRNDFSTKLDVAEAPATRTKGAIDDKNVAYRTLKDAIREAVQRYLAHNPEVTEKDHDDLGLPNYKTTRTPVPPPKGKVDFTIEQLGGSRLAVHYHAHDEERETKNAKPFGVHGVEYAWAILDAPPSSYADLVHSVFDTNSPYIFQFDLTDAGKHFYCCLRWENTTGQKGPWSEIQNAVIP